MDAMAFGMGSCCLQCTLQCCNINEARYFYDQFAVLAPIMVLSLFRLHFLFFFFRYLLCLCLLQESTMRLRCGFSLLSLAIVGVDSGVTCLSWLPVGH
jgi:hypothetical protein